MNSCEEINRIAAECSSCGNCLFACPVYNAELMEPLSPRGRINLIKSLMNGTLEPGPVNQKLIYQCALCGGCEHICTKDVQFVDLMIDYRTKAAKGKKIPLVKKLILAFYQSILFKKFTWAVDIAVKTPLRKMVSIPRRRKTKLSRLLSAKPQQEEYDILFFPGCVTTYFYPQIIEKTVGVLKNAGFSVVVPKGLACCGFPYISQGWQKKFHSLRKTNKKIFSRFNFKYLVVPCGTGTMTFKKYYGLEQVPQDSIFELTQFFYRFLPDLQVKLSTEKGSGTNTANETGEAGKITWHDPCHTLKSLGIADAPRHFMKSFGEDFKDDKSALCCGFGGIFSVGFPKTSKKILKRKVDKLNEIGADTVVTACPGCYFQLRENLPDDKKVKFFSDLF